MKNIATYYHNLMQGLPLQVTALDLSRYVGLTKTIARLLHRGELTSDELHEPLVRAIYKDLSNAFDDSWPKRYQFGADAGSDRTVLAMQRNLFRFSGAKSFALLQEMNGLLHKDGQIRPWNKFKDDVLKINEHYNRNYLQAEYQTARQAAHHARDWQDHVKDKDLFPSLEYKTVGDARVRDEHAALNGIVRPVDDPFWDEYYPPNGWRCRCYVQPSEDLKPKGTAPKESPLKPEFRGNVGKTGVVFGDKHPYFAMAGIGKKEAKIAFEKSKKFAPYFTAYRYRGNTVEVSPFADQSDFKENFKTAQILVDNGISVKIRPHVVLPGVKNPEYEIDKKMGERKSQLGKNVSSNLRASKRQGVRVIVFDVQDQYPYDIKDLKNSLKGQIKQHYADAFDTIIIVKGEKVEKIEVSELIK